MNVSNSNLNPSAGSAEPSWFEWQTGLLRLVEMLNDDSEVTAVAFQLHGTKGWDDVGVRFRNGTTRLFQMKHSRSGDTLTFGDLIGQEENGGSSLLGALARAWKQERAARGNVECVLVTNRRAGPNWYQGRPPLAEFFEKIKERISKVAELSSVTWDGEDKRYRSAWYLFLTELSDLDELEQIAFLQSLELETSAPDLGALEVQLYERLTALTGLPHSSVHALFNALHAHLRKWTCHTRREAEWQDREALRACLAGDEAVPSWLGHCEVETPEPFFPSRVPLVDQLRESLLSHSSFKVAFLSAEPGAGKTSCTSKLARGGAVRWQDQCVSIRFYAYRPIRPGQLDIGSDAGDVRPEALWLGLLWQIRDHLRTTHLLADLRVPVWLYGMTWEVAREHVMRLANELGQRWGRPFIVCIDGIDHAARARRNHMPEFLGTLPVPEVIPAHVRLLLAGQPAESYPEYPFFLRHPHDAVKVHLLGELANEDLRLLWRSAHPRMTSHAEDAVLRLLAEKTSRRTLPAVYAVEDIRDSATLEAAAAILDARPLPDSLHNYYDAIWSVAMVSTGDRHRLAAAFALLRERPTAGLLASAFSEMGKSIPEWKDILRALRPLVRETEQGFELVHNDLRVHLDARLAGDPFARRDAASELASHYRRSTSSRLAAHRSLLDLLISADREMEFADDFTVDWVIEAGALGISDETLSRECTTAFRAAISRRDWLLLHSVGCASLTLQRLYERETEWSQDDDPLKNSAVPMFLPVEGEPLPLELWSQSDFSELVAACEYLADCGALQRAAVVLNQWVGGISLETLVREVIAASSSDNARNQAGNALRDLFVRFGKICATCDVPLAKPESVDGQYAAFFAAVETGWSRGVMGQPRRRKALRLWCSKPPRFLEPWITAVRVAASNLRWGEVRALMNRINPGKIDSADRYVFGWYATRVKPKNLELWSEPFNQPNYGLVTGKTSIEVARIVAQWITYTNPVREPAQIADELFPVLDLRGMDSKNPAAVRLLLRGSAVIGLMLRYRDQSDFDGLAIAVPPAALEPYLRKLWCCSPDWRNLPHEEVNTPGEIGRDLANIAWECGSFYRQLLCDHAASRFSDVVCGRDGRRVFDMLWELGERTFLTKIVTTKAKEVLAHLHEDDASSRNSVVANLLHFVRKLEIPELYEELSARLREARIGYSSNREWVFQPLVRWFEILRKQSPTLWRTDGMQLLALNQISGQQGADNDFGDDLTAEVGAAAMACGPDDFEVLFGFLSGCETNHPLWDLAKAVRDGFGILLREGQAMCEESALAIASIAIAVGRWPSESPLSTVSGLINCYGAPPDIAHQPVWQQAVRVAAEIQGLPATIIPHEADQAESGERRETRSADAILADILQPTKSSWVGISDVAALAEQAKEENHPNRDELVAAALCAVESATAFGRCIQFHDIVLMSRLFANLTEPEFWRLLGAITAVTGEIRTELTDANWAFTVAFAAANLACRARAAEASHDFTLTVFRQLLGMHWKWHGVSPPAMPAVDGSTLSTWPDAARRMLLSLAQTDGCETLYMVMCGMRFFTDVFPGQIPDLCREGIPDERARDALLPLAQLWATRHPQALVSSLPLFEAHETTGTLDERLDAWVVGSLCKMVSRIPPRSFRVPSKDTSPEISFPGDEQLLQTEAEKNGLIQHNSFASMANERLRRAGLVLGDMEIAFRRLVRAFRESEVPAPSFYMCNAKNLAFESTYPRPSGHMKNFVGDAVLHQCAGQQWSPGEAAAVRLAIGYGMDPWIASATPNPWPENETWPSGFDVERWIEEGGSNAADIAHKIHALLEGGDLAVDTILLGAVLRIPTYRRDLEFRYWLAAPSEDDALARHASASTPSGRTIASWLAGWSWAESLSPDLTSVQFVGNLVNYPNSELEVTPTDEWMRTWGWIPDPRNALRFRASNGLLASWYERWLGPDTNSRRSHRQPFLVRWVAKRSCIPSEFGDLRAWRRCIERSSNPLSRPE